MTWPKVKLGELAEFINGAAFRPEDWGDDGLKIIRIQNLTDKNKPFNHTKRVVDKKLFVHKGDILVSWSATLGVYIWDRDEVGLLNQHIFKVVPNLKVIDKNYLEKSLVGALTDMNKHLHGATMKHVNRGEFLATEILLPPLVEQQRIASILDKAELVKRKRELAIEKLDELAQSVFIEMFGDPIKNEKSWKIVKLSQLAYKLGSGSTPTGGDASYKDFGISLIRSLNVHNGKFKYKNLAYIDDVQAKKLSNVSVESGDILLNITGASVARVCIVPKDILPARVNQHVMIIRPKEIVNNIFLEKLLLTKQMQNKLLGISGSGATRESITKAQAEELEIILPEINLQNKFSAIMMEMEKLALKENCGENKIINLFNSIQSKAFSGQL